jgi:hypothetical protein
MSSQFCVENLNFGLLFEREARTQWVWLWAQALPSRLSGYRGVFGNFDKNLPPVVNLATNIARV